MARATWTGTVRFGLMNLPIRLFKTVDEPKTIKFNELNPKTNNRINIKKVDAVTGEEVPEVVKGTLLSDGSYVLVDKDELLDAIPEKTTSIELTSFIDDHSIDPIYYDTPYAVGTDQGSVNTYGLLLEALRKTNKIAFGRFVMRGNEHLCLLRPTDDGLVLTTLRWHEQIRHLDQLCPQDFNVGERELEMATMLINMMSDEVDITSYRNEWNDKLVDLIESKAKGNTIKAAAPKTDDTDITDLVSALEASIEEAKKQKVETA